MGNLLGEPFPQYTKEQIKVRQKIYGKKDNRTPDEISYLNSRNAWVKLSSAVSLEKNRIDFLKVKNGISNPLMENVVPGDDLAKKYVLFNGLSSLDNLGNRAGITSPTNPNGAYGVGGTSFGYSPMPGIISADIKDLNRGSIKEATVNIKVHNPNQFDIIETLYMRIGYYILLEWGNNMYLTDDGNGGFNRTNNIITAGESEWWKFNNKKSTDNVLFSIEKLRRKNKGNYDALFGQITNFSWEFQKDGTYNVIIKIYSVGDVIESLKLNTPSDNIQDSKTPSPSDIQDFAQLKIKGRNNPVDIESFYNILYPGLREQLSVFYDEMQNIGFHNIFGGVYDSNPAYKPSNATLGKGYDKMFELRVTSYSTFRPYVLGEGDTNAKDLNFSYDDSGQTVVEELQNNKEIVDSILTPFSEIRKSQPAIGEIISDYGKYSPDKFSGQSWIVKFFREIIVNTDDYYENFIVKKFVTNPNANGGFNDSMISTSGPRREFLVGEGDTSEVVTLELSGGDNFTFQDQNITVRRIGNRYTNSSGQAEVQYSTGSLSNAVKGWDGYDDDKNNTLENMGKGYGAKAGGAGWAGVKNGWFYIDDGLDELLQGGDFAFDKQAPPLEEGPIALNQIIKPEIVQNKVISELIFLLCDKDKFFRFVYDLFVEADRAGGEDDPRFQFPEDEDITEESEEVSKYDAELEEKKNKNKIFNWFYNIRKLYPLYTYTTTNLNSVTKPALETLAKVQLFETTQINRFPGELKEMGRIINPYDKTVDPLSLDEKAQKKLQKRVKEGLRNLGNSGNLNYINKISDPNELNNILKTAAENSDKPLSPSQKGLTALLDLGTRTKEEVATEWNEKVKFPIYTVQKQRDFAFLFVNPIENSYFVRLGVLLDFIEENIIFKINDKTKAIKFDTDIETNICYTIDNVISTNITKCIIANKNFYYDSVGTQDKYHSVFQNLDPFIGTHDGYYYGKIMNIYFNFNRVEQIMQGVNNQNEIDLFTFLKALTDDINECTGNITNIEPVINKETNTIKFIDQTTIPGLEQIAKALGINEYNEEDVTLEIYGYNGNKSTFVRNVGLKTEISKEYGAMITIGATANGALPGSEATALSKWNIGINDRFKQISDGGDSKEKSFEEQYEQVIEAYKNLIRKSYARCGLNFASEDNNFIINYDYISTVQDVFSNYYKYAQAATMQSFLEDSKAIVESSIGFIPFNLSLEMDGISGIKIYNRVRVNTSFLPSNYGNSLDFIVSGVNHKIENNEWVTTLETIATSKYKDGS